jgi:hypothetical protein
MIENYKQLINEIEMLKGNINRMCITNDLEEIERMYYFAKYRIDEIYRYNFERINKEGESK